MNYADEKKSPARDIALEEVRVSEETGNFVYLGVEIPLREGLYPRAYVHTFRPRLERVIEEIRKQR